MLKKCFNTFKEGLKEMMEISMSIRQAILQNGPNPLELDEEPLTLAEETPESQAVANLAQNAYFDVTDEVYVNVDKNYVEYMTSGGLKFGWRYIYEDYEKYYEFFVDHYKYIPDCEDGDSLEEELKQIEEMKKNSSLYADFMAEGWEE